MSIDASTAEADVAFAGPGALASRVRARDISPHELVALYLERIQALDPQLNAVRDTVAEQAFAEADAVNDCNGALAGVPVAVKDETAFAGQTATFGTRQLLTPAADDAVLLARLRAAGAIPVAITNVPELMIFPWTASQANGITRNPWDPSRTPGGSSGGSAAAVAAGLAPMATAADGGGSIRIPAAACGLVGLKPTRGALADDGGWLDLAVSGTLTRTVADTALLYGVTHGITAPPLTRALRIAVSRKVPAGLPVPVSPGQRDAHARVAHTLEGLGHHMVQRSPAYGAAQFEFLQTWLRAVSEAADALPDPELLEPSTRGMAAVGRIAVPRWRRDRLLAHRAETTRRILRLWDEIDVLLTPGLACTAIEAGGGYGRSAPFAVNLAGRFTPFTAVFNLTGQPAITVPAGFDDDGLPLSVQLVGRPGAEAVLLGLAAQLEAASPWVHRRPPGF
jgi:amidase